MHDSLKTQAGSDTMSLPEILATVFPEQNFKSAHFLGEGMDSLAYLVDGAYVFRFPKREEVAQNLAKEIALLPHLQHLPLRVPDFQFVGQHPENGLPFVGYPLLKGVEWQESHFLSQPPKNQTKALGLLGRFLMELHRFDVDTALQLGIEISETYQDYIKDYEEIQAKLFPFSSPLLRDLINQRFTAFLANPKHFQYTNCLIHDDFSSNHILCDPETGMPQSVIDFGDVPVGDPDLDLKYLYAELGRSFIERLLAEGHYKTPTDPEVLLEKLDFFNFCEAFQDVLHEHEDDPEQAAITLQAVLLS